MYDPLTPVDGSRSLPVPTKMYSCVPTATAAIDEKIGCPAPAEYNLVGVPGNRGLLLESLSMANRQMLPSRSPMYDLVMNRSSDGPVATGSACSAFLNFVHPYAAAVQLSSVSATPSLAGLDSWLA